MSEWIWVRLYMFRIGPFKKLSSSNNFFEKMFSTKSSASIVICSLKESTFEWWVASEGLEESQCSLEVAVLAWLTHSLLSPTLSSFLPLALLLPAACSHSIIILITPFTCISVPIFTSAIKYKTWEGNWICPHICLSMFFLPSWYSKFPSFRELPLAIHLGQVCWQQILYFPSFQNAIILPVTPNIFKQLLFFFISDVPNFCYHFPFVLVS